MNIEYHILPGYPDFSDLPWDSNLGNWPEITDKLVQVECGVSRHPIVFAYDKGIIYAIKELPNRLAISEFDNIKELNNLRLPAVTAVGYVIVLCDERAFSYIITKFLEYSIPYHSIFLRSSLDRYRHHILDAMAGLLVQLHLNGVFWGDCSLSNTLFRRDAGTLQAYLVDAETVELYSSRLNPNLRLHDLEIMQENIQAELSNINTVGGEINIPLAESGNYVRKRYQELWEEITSELIVGTDEQYRLHDKITSLNQMGFSIKDLEYLPDHNGDKIRIRVIVTARNFHRDRLFELTGITAEEKQAQQMVNEIQQVKANLSRENNRETPINTAAHYWLNNIYEPVIERFQPLIHKNKYLLRNTAPAEFYCQILENKWFLSEKANKDIGHQAAVDDYLRRFNS